MISRDAPPFIGGMGRHVGNLVGGLREAGVTVSLFDRSKRCVPSFFGSAGFSFGLSLVLQRWIFEKKITLLHLHTGPGGAFLPSPSGVPFVVTANHTYAAQARLPGQSWKCVFVPWEKATYRAAHRVICLSDDTADSVEHDYGIDRTILRIIPCGFPLAPWVSSDVSDAQRDRWSCVFVGRPQTRKGWDLLLNAWRRVRTDFPQARVHVVGFVGAEEEGIQFHGRISDDELHFLIGHSRFVVCPSRLEGFGLAAAEAIAAGTPVIGMRVAGLQRVIVDGESGILTDVSAVALADKMQILFKDDVLWATLHRGCQRLRSVFDHEKEIALHQQVYDEVYSDAL